MKLKQDGVNTHNFKHISPKSYKLMLGIIEKLDLILKGKRALTYSDIINLIIREGYVGDSYNEIILWCNYKIRLGEFYVAL